MALAGASCLARREGRSDAEPGGVAPASVTTLATPEVGGRSQAAAPAGSETRPADATGAPPTGDGATPRAVSDAGSPLPACTSPTTPGARAPRRLAMADVKTGCLVGRDGHVRCWGLDPTAVGERPRKATPVDGLDEVVEVAVAGTYACARRRDGAVHCFDQRPQGVRRAELGDRAVAVAAGGRNVTCAALAGGDVTCLDGGAWSMSAGVHDAVDVQVGYAHRCALHRDGTISCWGANDRGQLGRPAAPGPGDDMPGPGGAARVPSVTGARAIASGTWADHVCVTRCDGEVVCWGSGRGFDVPDEAPPTTLPGAAAVEHLAVGIDFTCAAGRSGAPRCWGSRAPVTRKDPAAGPASLKRTGEVVELVAAHSTVCVLGTNELVTCWTRHDDDTIGEPTRIPGL